MFSYSVDCAHIVHVVVAIVVVAAIDVAVFPAFKVSLSAAFIVM